MRGSAIMESRAPLGGDLSRSGRYGAPVCRPCSFRLPAGGSGSQFAAPCRVVSPSWVKSTKSKCACVFTLHRDLLTYTNIQWHERGRSYPVTPPISRVTCTGEMAWAAGSEGGMKSHVCQREVLFRRGWGFRELHGPIRCLLAVFVPPGTSFSRKMLVKELRASYL